MAWPCDHHKPFVAVSPETCSLCFVNYKFIALVQLCAYKLCASIFACLCRFVIHVYAHAALRCIGSVCVPIPLQLCLYLQHVFLNAVLHEDPKLE